MPSVDNPIHSLNWADFPSFISRELVAAPAPETEVMMLANRRNAKQTHGAGFDESLFPAAGVLPPNQPAAPVDPS